MHGVPHGSLASGGTGPSHPSFPGLRGLARPSSSPLRTWVWVVRIHEHHVASGSTAPVGRRTGTNNVSTQSILIGILALVVLPTCCPLFGDSGLPAQVQNVDILLLQLAVTRSWSCLGLECTISPVLNLHLIVSRFGGSTTRQVVLCWIHYWS